MKNFILAILMIATISASAQIKISELPTKLGGNTGEAFIPIVDSGVTKKIQANKLLGLADLNSFQYNGYGSLNFTTQSLGNVVFTANGVGGGAGSSFGVHGDRIGFSSAGNNIRFQGTQFYPIGSGISLGTSSYRWDYGYLNNLNTYYFRLPISAGLGKTLVSNENGDGTWQTWSLDSILKYDNDARNYTPTFGGLNLYSINNDVNGHLYYDEDNFVFVDEGRGDINFYFNYAEAFFSFNSDNGAVSFLYDGISGSRSFRLPDADGQIAIANPDGIVGHPTNGYSYLINSNGYSATVPVGTFLLYKSGSKLMIKDENGADIQIAAF